MAFCSQKCTKLPPRPVSESSCEQQLRSGGISRLVFASCNLEFKNIQDPGEWCTYVRDGLISVSPFIMGQKAKGEFTKKRTNSCQAEKMVGVSRTITFQDFSADNVNFKDFNYWTDIINNQDYLQFGWITCEGLFYGFYPSFAAEIDLVIEDTNLGSTFWDGSVSWQGFHFPPPVRIHNLTSIIQGNCSNVLNYDDCPPATDFEIEISNFGVICGPEGVVLKAPYFSDATYQWNEIGVGPVFNANTNTITVYTANAYEVVITRPRGCGFTLTVDNLTSGQPLLDNPQITVAPNASHAINGNVDITLNLDPSETDYHIYGWKFLDDPTPINYIYSSNTFVGAEPGVTYILGVKNTITQCATEVIIVAPSYP